jgi:hypothetical protein
VASPIDVTHVLSTLTFDVVQFQKPCNMKVTNISSSFLLILVKDVMFVIALITRNLAYLYALVVISPWVWNVQLFRS